MILLLWGDHPPFIPPLKLPQTDTDDLGDILAEKNPFSQWGHAIVVAGNIERHFLLDFEELEFAANQFATGDSG